MAITWHAEACDLAPDPVSGARITRLTSTAMHNVNLYFEQPYGTPDGTRVAYGRALHADPRLPPTELCVADLIRKKVSPIDSDIVSTWFATSSWSGQLHYLRANGELIRVDLSNLEKTICLTHFPIDPPLTLWSVTPDMRYLVVGRRDPYDRLFRVDLQSGETELLAEDRVCRFSHVQIHHVNGRQVLAQLNRPKLAATHIIIDLFSGERTELAIGEPHTLPSTGHASWLGETGRIVTPVQWPGMAVDFGGDGHQPAHDPRHPDGNLISVGPDDPGPIAFPAPLELFNHASSSRCGRYVVSESFRHGIPGAVAIIVCDMVSGRHAVLVSDCGSSGGGPACSHVHAYFTADTRRVVYNADPHGTCHLHVAELPDGFLDALA